MPPEDYSNVTNATRMCSGRKRGTMSTAAALAAHTYLPTDASDSVADVLSFLSAHTAARGSDVTPRYLLVGASEGDQVEVPETVYQALRQVVESLAAGRAVTVAPHAPTLTTQEAADLLGVSRPTVVRLIDSGILPCERIGSRRKVLLRDLLEYREQRRRHQYEMLAATSVGLDDEDDPAQVVAELRAARRIVAARHRST